MNLLNILLTIVAYIQQYLYKPLNVPHPREFVEITGLDRIIPFVPVFILPYLSMYFFVLLTFFILVFRRNQKNLSVFLLAAIITWSISNYIYAAWPTQNIIRPDITGTDLFSALVKRMYDSLGVYNTFPSGHNASAALAAFTAWRLKWKLAWLWIVWGALICLSTLLVRQHYLLDVIGSVPLAIVSYLAAERALRQ